ncbi:MAG: putative zinc-binding metallopeptidase [Planctomycetota bacterium]
MKRSLARVAEAELLDTRLCDLDLELQGTWLEDCVADLYASLARRELAFRPHVWLSSDWFSPTGVPGIAIPFYLAHPRLMKLERAQMLECEGGTRADCLRILRHECGHAIQHAYGLHRRRAWRAHFGRSGAHYPSHYRPDPASRGFVMHLPRNYAQSHPDEDFAETFAVWLTPRAIWRRRYAGWPALAKLEYLEELMEELAGQPAPVRSRAQLDPLRTLRFTLREHYRRKRAHYTRDVGRAYDRELRQLFSDSPRHRRKELAATFLRRNRTEIRRMVSRWTGEYQFTLEQVLDDMIVRCGKLKLRAAAPERKLRVDFALLLTVKAVHSLHAHRDWVAL